MTTADICIVAFVVCFYAATICVPSKFYAGLLKKLKCDQQRGNSDNDADKIARQLANETFFLRNHLRGVGQRANDRDIKQILDDIIFNVVPDKKQEKSK